MAFGLKLTVDGRPGDLEKAFRGELEKEIESERRSVAAAYAGAMDDVVQKDLTELRADITGGGFYNAIKLSKTWRGQRYPKKDTLEPAGFIWNKAATIIDVFTNGAMITVSNARYLAIPEGPAKAIVHRLNQSRYRSRDASGRFADEAGYVQRVAQALGVDRLEARIDQNTGRGVLIAAGQKLTRTGRHSARAGPETVLFALVRQVNLPGRIRGAALLQEMEGRALSDFSGALAGRLGESE